MRPKVTWTESVFSSFNRQVMPMTGTKKLCTFPSCWDNVFPSQSRHFYPPAVQTILHPEITSGSKTLQINHEPVSFLKRYAAQVELHVCSRAPQNWLSIGFFGSKVPIVPDFLLTVVNPKKPCGITALFHAASSETLQFHNS